MVVDDDLNRAGEGKDCGRIEGIAWLWGLSEQPIRINNNQPQHAWGTSFPYRQLWTGWPTSPTTSDPSSTPARPETVIMTNDPKRVESV